MEKTSDVVELSRNTPIGGLRVPPLRRVTLFGRQLLVERVASGRPAAHVAAEMGISRNTATNAASGTIGTAVNTKPMIMASTTGGRPGGEVRRNIPGRLWASVASRSCQWSS